MLKSEHRIYMQIIFCYNTSVTIKPIINKFFDSLKLTTQAQKVAESQYVISNPLHKEERRQTIEDYMLPKMIKAVISSKTKHQFICYQVASYQHVLIMSNTNANPIMCVIALPQIILFIVNQAFH